MLHVTTNVNKDHRNFIGVMLDFLLERVHVPANSLIFAAVLHVLVERLCSLWMVHESKKCGQRRLVRHLMRGIGIVCDILIFIIREKAWKSLKKRSNSVEPESRDEVKAISRRECNHGWVNHLEDYHSHIIYADLISRNSQSGSLKALRLALKEREVWRG